MHKYNSTNIPIHNFIKLTIDVQDKEILEKTNIHRYQSIIGSLIFAIQKTRPDLVQTISLYSRFLAKPNLTYIGIVKGILRYLNSFTDLEITYYRDNAENLFAHTDSNY